MISVLNILIFMQRIYATLYIQICFNSICTKIASMVTIEKIEVETKIHFLHIWLLTAFVQM